jgi:hypothetical protein
MGGMFGEKMLFSIIKAQKTVVADASNLRLQAIFYSGSATESLSHILLPIVSSLDKPVVTASITPVDRQF